MVGEAEHHESKLATQMYIWKRFLIGYHNHRYKYLYQIINIFNHNKIDKIKFASLLLTSFPILQPVNILVNTRCVFILPTSLRTNIESYLNDQDISVLKKASRIWWHNYDDQQTQLMIGLLNSQCTVWTIFHACFDVNNFRHFMSKLVFNQSLWKYSQLQVMKQFALSQVTISSPVKNCRYVPPNLIVKTFCPIVIATIGHLMTRADYYNNIQINSVWYKTLKSRIFVNACIWNKLLVIKNEQYFRIDAQSTSLYEYSGNTRIQFDVNEIVGKKNTYFPRIPCGYTQIYEGTDIMLVNYGELATKLQYMFLYSNGKRVSSTWIDTCNLWFKIMKTVPYCVMRHLFSLAPMSHSIESQKIIFQHAHIPCSLMDRLCYQELLRKQSFVFYGCTFESWIKDEDDYDDTGYKKIPNGLIYLPQSTDTRLIFLNVQDWYFLEKMSLASVFVYGVQSLVIQGDLSKNKNNVDIYSVSGLIAQFTSNCRWSSIKQVLLLFDVSLYDFHALYGFGDMLESVQSEFRLLKRRLTKFVIGIQVYDVKSHTSQQHALNVVSCIKENYEMKIDDFHEDLWNMLNGICDTNKCNNSLFCECVQEVKSWI